MHALRMLVAASVVVTTSLWHATGCYAEAPELGPPAASSTPAQPAAKSATKITPIASTAPVESANQPDSSEIGTLKAQITALDKVLDQMQKVDSKIANIAPWIAAAIAFVTAFVAIMPILFFGYEWSVRRANERKFDEYKTDLRNEIDRQMKMTKDDITRTVEERIDVRIDHIISSELRRITQNIEGDYSKNLAQVETACYCLIQNEFPRKWKESDGPNAIEQMHIFRYLLIHLVGGDGRERLAALHRLASEYVDLCGPTTRNSIAALLKSLESDIRFARQDLARSLQDLKERCLRPMRVTRDPGLTSPAGHVGGSTVSSTAPDHVPAGGSLTAQTDRFAQGPG